MSQLHPPADTLLHAARGYLRETLLPSLPREQQYPVRIVASLLAIVQREIALGAAAERREEEGLRELLGQEGSLEDLRSSLVRALCEGRTDPLDPALVALLREASAAALEINNPRWLSEARDPRSGG